MKGRKHCGKRRKCWSPAFSPFPTMFSKAYFFRVVKKQDCVVESWCISAMHCVKKDIIISYYWFLKSILFDNQLYHNTDRSFDKAEDWPMANNLDQHGVCIGWHGSKPFDMGQCFTDFVVCKSFRFCNSKLHHFVKIYYWLKIHYTLSFCYV